jgi:L-fucose isomerase
MTDKKPGSTVTFGVCAACDPRIDEASRTRTANIIRILADIIAREVKMPDGKAVKVVWSPVLIDGEPQADIVASQFKEAGVQAIVCTPDTWAFPQLTFMSLLAHFPKGSSCEYHVREQRAQTGGGVCPCPERRPCPVGTAHSPECGQLA